MLKSFTVAAALVAVAAIAVLATWAVSSHTPHVGAATAVDVAIDMDVTGNDARLTGGADVQDCGEIDSAGTNEIEIDVILPPPGVDAADGLNGYQLDLNYDPAVVDVTAEDFDSYLLNQAVGSFLLPLSSGVPGTYSSGVAELGLPFGIEPAGVSEVGPGVMVRLTLTGVAPGASDLTLTNVIPVDGVLKEAIPVNNVFNATVVVDGTCAAPPPKASDVRIASLDCNSEPEVVRIKNFGNDTQDLTGWQLVSNPAQVFDLSVAGSLAPDLAATILSGPDPDPPATFGDFEWPGGAEVFADGDTSDFARIVDDSSVEIDEVACDAGEMIEDNVGGYDPTSAEDNTCADGVDNDADTVADAADGKCHTDGEPTNALSYDPTLNEDVEFTTTHTCGDTLDNGGDTVADTADPDCHADGDAGNPDTYKWNLDEDDVFTCSDGIENGNNDGTDAADTDCVEAVSTDGPPLEESSTSGPSDVAGEDDPVEVTVLAPSGGTVRIEEKAIALTAPSGFELLGQQVSIQAPTATTDLPLIIEFYLDDTIVPDHADATMVQIFKDGQQVQDCTGAAGTASPDPCVSERVGGTGFAPLHTVLTSEVSEWTFGAAPLAPTPTPTPAPVPAATPTPPAPSLPKTGDNVPVGEPGGSPLPWLLVGLGATIGAVAAGYLIYARTRSRVSR
jgi:hypothetical protein